MFRPRGSSDERPSFRPRTSSSSARPAFKPRTSSDARPFPSKPRLKITVAPATLVKKVSKRAKVEAEEIKNAPGIETSGKIRLNKFISNAGISSRRKADELITQGAVTVNGKIVTELGVQVRAYEDLVTVNGETISLRPRFLYILLNKPKDTITTTDDERDRKTVMDYVATTDRIYPIGRLDRNTTGVLLLTNDGELTNRLTHPSFEIEREYHVTLDKRLDREDAKRIAEGGINLGEGDITGKAELAVAEDNPKDVVLLLREGKNREVRRIFETLGYEVEKLDRTSFAGITHRGMSRGESRPLSNPELHRLRKLAGIEE